VLYIEQYFLCSAAQLTSCSSPAAAASRLTSSTLPHVSLGASQLLNLRRHHREAMAAGNGLGTTSRRRKPTVENCVDNTAKLRPQASALAPRPCKCNAQRAAPRVTAFTPRSSTCVAPRALAGHHDQAPATHNERCRGKRPGRND
jgi:hypothetical protein